MQKKLFMPAMILASTLLYSCGQMGGLNADGKVHKLEDSVMVIGANGTFYNYEESIKTLDEENDVWVTEEVKVSNKYQKIKDPSGDNFRFITTSEIYEEFYDKDLKKVVGVEHTAVEESITRVNLTVGNVTKGLKTDDEMKFFVIDNIDFGDWFEADLGEEIGQITLIPVNTVRFILGEIKSEAKKGCVNQESKYYRTEFVEGTYFFSTDYGIENGRLTSIFVLKDEVYSEISLEGEDLSTHLQADTKKLISEGKGRYPQVLIEGSPMF